MSLTDDLLNRLLAKSDKQDSINKATYERFAEVDKRLEVHITQSNIRMDGLRKDVDDHPVNCPANKTEVRRIVHEIINSRDLEKELADKAKAKVDEAVKEKDVTKGIVSLFKAAHPIERFIILLIILFFVLDKFKFWDWLFNTVGN